MNNSTPGWLWQIQDSLPAGQFLLVKEELSHRTRQIADLESQLAAAEQERDKICRDGLAVLAGAGVITPEKGFPNLHELLADVRVGLRDKNKEIKAVEQQAEKAEKETNKRICASCLEKHPVSSSCHPHEVRISGPEWYRVKIRQREEMIEQLEADNAAIQEAVKKKGWKYGCDSWWCIFCGAEKGTRHQSTCITQADHPGTRLLVDFRLQDSIVTQQKKNIKELNNSIRNRILESGRLLKERAADKERLEEAEVGKRLLGDLTEIVKLLLERLEAAEKLKRDIKEQIHIMQRNGNWGDAGNLTSVIKRYDATKPAEAETKETKSPVETLDEFDKAMEPDP